jgi:methyl-accepting chemotaxis protein
MNLTQRLLLTLAVALLALLLVGGLGLNRLSQSQDRLEFLQSHVFANTNLMADLKAKFEGGRTYGYQHTFTYDSDDKDAISKKIVTRDQDIDTLFADYVRHPLDDQDRVLTQQVQNAIQDYRKLRTDLLASSSDNDTKTARNILMGPLIDKNKAVEAAFDNHQAYLNDIAEKTNKKNTESYQTATTLLISVIIGGVVISGILAFMLYSIIHQSLHGIQSAMRRVNDTLDFTHRAPVLRHDEIGMTSIAFNNLLERLQHNLQDILDGSRTVATSAQELSHNSSKVTEASHVQSEASSSMAASIEELTVSINHLSHQAGEALELARTSGELATKGSTTIVQTISDIRNIADSVANVTESVKELDEYSTTVARVVQVIRDVAEQTNLLALNAAIEAARAGEQGRGFAVVADEVRLLAQRTANSTLEISQAIDAMRHKSSEVNLKISSAEQLVKTSVARADNADHAIKEIGQAAIASTNVVNEITHALKEQGIASDNIAHNVDQIAHMAEETNVSISNTSAIARRVDELASKQMATLLHYKL